MPNVIEHASSGRAKCRACRETIAKDELRLGERLPNSFGDGEMTLWYHLPCAAYKRPQALIDGLASDDTPEYTDEETALIEPLQTAAEFGIEHEQVAHLIGASLAPTGRAKCRACKNSIEKGSWRLGLSIFEEYGFQAAGFIHAHCANDYFSTTAIMDPIRHFSPDLTSEQLTELTAALDL